MSFKVGDKVRVKGAKPVGVIYQPSDSLYGWAAEFETEDKRYFFLDQKRAEALGIELEHVEPALPEEPPVGTTIRFDGHDDIDGIFTHTKDSTGEVLWLNSQGGWEWSGLMSDFGTDFTVLEERDKTIREVLDWQTMKGYLSDYGEEVTAEHFGVSLGG